MKLLPTFLDSEDDIRFEFEIKHGQYDVCLECYSSFIEGFTHITLPVKLDILWTNTGAPLEHYKKNNFTHVTKK